uniref:peptidylprolyl isomerase n=1 Tax=candidate division WOR-3 bacterium TaxID=2052148 RepID=A0A7V3PU33_UNCW3
MNIWTKWLLTGIFILSLGCNRSPADLQQPKGKVVGTVNSDRLTVPQVNYAAEQLRAEVNSTNLPKILDRMATVSLLAEEAVRRGMLKDEKVVSGLAWVERMYLASELASRIADTSEPAPAEVLKYFQEHKSEFGTGLKLQLMVLPDSTYAEQTLKELQAGADFLKIARERSMDTSFINVPGYPTRGVGLSLGWSLADEERVFSLKPGEISPVLTTQVGYQIVKVLERKTLNENPTMSEMTQLYISEALKEQRRRQTLDSLLTSLRARAKIVLKPEEYTR